MRELLAGYKPALLLLAGFILIPLTVGRSADIQNILIYILIFAMAGEGWNLISGLAGQISFGHAAYFGIGAYATAILGNSYNVTPWIGIPVGAAIAAGLAWLVNYNLFRFKAHYFAVASLVVCELLHTIFGVWSFAGAGSGIKILYRPEGKLLWLALDVDNRLPFLYITLAAYVVVFVVCRYLAGSQMGYFWRAVRDSHEVAGALGIRTQRVKGYAMLFSAFITAVAGGLYVQFIKYIDNSVFSLDMSLVFLLVVILGGLGSRYGPIVGSILYYGLDTLLGRVPGAGGTGLSLAIFGLLLAVVVCYQPGGLTGIASKALARWRERRAADG